jgi:hypothetical protein
MSNHQARLVTGSLRLTPKQEQEFRVLLVEVNPDHCNWSGLSFVDWQGARSDFLFSAVRENVPAAEARFIPCLPIEIRKE